MQGLRPVKFWAQVVDLGKRNDSRSEVTGIDQLLEQINLDLADGDIITLNNKIALVEEGILKLLAAKKYAAYCTAKEKVKADTEIKRFEDAKFQQIDENFGEYSRKQEFLAAKNIEKNETAQRGMHYPWLKDALEEYQKGLGEIKITRRPRDLIIALFFLVLSIILIILDQRWPALGSILLSFGSWYWFFQQANKLQSNHAQAQELDQIRASYQEKFDEPCKDISTMRVKLEAIAADYHAVQQIEKDIEKAEATIQSLASEIQQGLKDLEKKIIPPERWEEAISSYRQEISDLNTQSRQYEKDLAHYDVDPSDYVIIDPGIPYKRDDYDTAKVERDHLIDERTNLEQSLQNLKSEVQAIILDHSITDWSELVNKLREKRSKKSEEYKRYTAEIVAGNLLNQTIEKIREQEDDKISENLELPIVQEPLKQISKHYVGVELEDGSVKSNG